MRVRLFGAIVSFSAVATLAGVAPVGAQSASGELRCSEASGFGFLMGSKRQLSCVYYRTDGAVEFYVGSTSRVGFDLGPQLATHLVYQVVGVPPATRAALQGDFGGAGFGATLGRGVGADSLVGTSGATLVPLANAAPTGLNINAGLGVLHLDYAGMEPYRR